MSTQARIDVHAHCVPDFYRDWCMDNRLDTNNLKMPSWDLERSLSFMDQAGIQSTVLSVSAPGVDFAIKTEASEMARRLNIQLAEIADFKPNRFGFFALLPQRDTNASLKEIAYVFDILKADGVVIRPNVEGKYIGAAGFATVLKELNRGARLFCCTRRSFQAVPPLTFPHTWPTFCSTPCVERSA